MQELDEAVIQQLISEMDGLHARISSDQRDLFRLIVDSDRCEVWEDWGARDLAHFLSMRYDVSYWKAARWVAAAHALERLPLISEAFASGQLGIDKVCELTRFATPETEEELLGWAKRVACFFIRAKADLESRRALAEVLEAERTRSVRYWSSEDGTRIGLSADFPAAEGAVVVRAIDRMASRVPVMPGEEDPHNQEARRADALVALASAHLGSDPDADRATVVVHASLQALVAEERGAQIEGGPVIHAETVRRLVCSARLQAVIEDEAGDPVGIGRVSRDPSASMMRLLRHRDFGCSFPGCGTRAFTQAHHIVWWERGGRTDLDNLVLVCFFHHKLVHEYGWKIRRGANGTAEWFHPDGKRHSAGPSPPRSTVERQPVFAATGY